MPATILALDVPGADDHVPAGAAELHRLSLEAARAGEGRAILARPDTAVVLRIASAASVLQAAWLEHLRDASLATFTEWWQDASRSHPTAARWRYDDVAAGWVEAVGADRVHVVLGETGGASPVGSLLEPAPGAPSGAPLPSAHVALVDGLVTELRALELTGRHARHLVHSAAVALRREATWGSGSTCGPRDGTGAAARLTGEMADTLLSTGVHVHGDPELLRIGAGVHPDVAATVDLAEALPLALGVLEGVLAWGRATEPTP